MKFRPDAVATEKPRFADYGRSGAPSIGNARCGPPATKATTQLKQKKFEWTTRGPGIASSAVVFRVLAGIHVLVSRIENFVQGFSV